MSARNGSPNTISSMSWLLICAQACAIRAARLPASTPSDCWNRSKAQWNVSDVLPALRDCGRIRCDRRDCAHHSRGIVPTVHRGRDRAHVRSRQSTAARGVSSDLRRDHDTATRRAVTRQTEPRRLCAPIPWYRRLRPVCHPGSASPARAVVPGRPDSGCSPAGR